MCLVSMIVDEYSRRDKWPKWPQTIPFPEPWTIPDAVSPHVPTPLTIFDKVTREEFEALKAQVEQMKRELEAARKQDENEGNPDCEMEEKVAVLKKIAEIVGVDLSKVFPND